MMLAILVVVLQMIMQELLSAFVHASEDFSEKTHNYEEIENDEVGYQPIMVVF